MMLNNKYQLRNSIRLPTILMLIFLLFNFGTFATFSEKSINVSQNQTNQKAVDYEIIDDLSVSDVKNRGKVSSELSIAQFNEQTLNKTVDGYRSDFFLPEGLKPYELIKLPEGNLWFTVHDSTNLWELNVTSLSLTPHPLQANITPLILRSDGNGNIVFTDNDFAINKVEHDYIGRYYVETGNYDLYQVPTLDSSPFDVLFRDDKIWYTEWMANKIGMIDLATNSTTEFDIPCEEGGCGPLGLNFDQFGHLWIVDTFRNQFYKFNPENQQFSKFPLPDKFYSPVVASFDEDGNIWTGEHGGDNILRFNPYTSKTDQFMTRKPKENQYPISGPNDIVFDSNGDVWFSEHFVDLVGHLDRETNTLIEYPIPREEPLIQWIYMDDNDRLWMAEEGTSIISMINTTITPTFTISSPEPVEVPQGGSTTISLEVEFVDGFQNSFTVNSFGEIKDYVDITFQNDGSRNLDIGQSIKLQQTITVGDNVDPSTYTAIIGMKSGDLSATIEVQIKVSQGSIFSKLLDEIFIFGITGILVILAMWKYYRGKKTT